MDKRRLCAAHPFRGQANLTRSWCNGVALCRTSSLQQAFKSCRWLVCRTRNTTAEGPSELSWGSESARRIQPAEERSGTRRSSPENPQSVFFFFYLQFQLVLPVSLAEHTTARWEPELLLRLRFHTVKSSHRWSGPRMPLRLGEVAPLSFFTGTRC